jgi:hypothetical protein
MERRWYMLEADMFSTIDWSKTLFTSDSAYWNVDNTQFIFAIEMNELYLIDICNYDDWYIAGILLDDSWGNIILENARP